MALLARQAALPPPDTIRTTAEEVVSRPYFDLDYGRNSSSEAFLLDVIRWLFRPFLWLFESLEGLPDFLRWVIVAACLLILILLVAHIVYTLVSALQVPQLPKGPGTGSSRQESDPAELELQAESCETEGDYIGAIRLLFRSAIRRIELAERKRFRPGFSNHELLRRYRTTPLANSLKLFVETIDRKWYGDWPCDQSDYLDCYQEHAKIREFLQRRISPC